MMNDKPIPRRCAIYTRKSSEEGLEQDFNSLHAQRESCLAYIKSQKSEGWIPVKDHYDDGGYSGGNMERPGLKQLMEDIKSGKVHIVVVYKIDRLTRSLMDFAKLVEVFDQHQVTFVSITQSFNTTTSMGRLTLNMLLSFAQFEREVTGERIRDKIAASKAKGIWMGGHLPIGYDVNERKLVINPAEAEAVRYIFKRYLELGNARLLQEDLERENIRSKIREKTGGNSFLCGALYHILSNPIYIGQIRHKNICHPGQHESIIEQAIWDEVQKLLKENAPVIKSKSRKTESSMLTGKIFDESGERLTPSHANKKGRRYRYYISRRLMTGVVDQANHGWRLPAQEIEHTVIKAVQHILTDRHVITSAMQDAGIDSHHIPHILKTAGDISKKLKSETSAADMIPAMINRIDLRQDGITLNLSLASIIPASINKSSLNPTITHNVSMKMQRRGVEMRLVIQSTGIPAKVDPSLIKAVARAHKWFGELASGQVDSITAIATREKIDKGYVSHIVNLAFLAPDIIESITTGKQPSNLTPQMLMKRINLPLDWSEQQRLLKVA